MSAAERLSAVRAVIAERERAAVVVTHLPSVRYLTGYVGSNGIAVVSHDAAVLLTDARYAVAARAAAAEGVDVVIGTRDLLEDTAREVARLTPGDADVAVEAQHMTLAQHGRLGDLLAGRGGGRTLRPEGGIVEGVRAVKEPGEVACIARAAAIADRALARVLAAGVAGRTERQVAWDLLGAMRDEGAEGASFDIIVAAAANGARPHAVPTDAVIGDDTLLVVDMGAVFDGYCSDMTRTVVLGDPGDELRDIYRVCHEAQRAALAAVRAGIGCGELDAVARGVIDEAGYGAYYEHGLGHGVGLEIHEAPRVGRDAPGTLAAGMVVTIEPGIYLEGRGGVRIEDLVVVTDDGCTVLSGAPKDTV